MPQKVLGLDLGSFSVKGALFETTFRSFELTDLFESPPLKADDLAPAERTTVTTEAILRILEENNLRPSTIVTALPGMEVSTRILTLPLPEKQVPKVLPFELESQIPFELSEIIVDHHVISAARKETTVLAAAIRKTFLAQHLGLLRNATVDPAFVGLDSLSLYNLNLLNLAEQPRTYAIVDMGHQKSSICIVTDSNAQYVRTLLTGGRHINEAIREGLDLTLDQAVEVKHDHGILELENQPLQSRDLQRLSAAIRKAVDPLIRDVLQTLHAHRTSYATQEGSLLPVEKIYLCGGTSHLRNLPNYLSDLTRLPVERIRLFSQDHPISERLGAREPTFAQAVALGLRASARGTNAKHVASVNFRKAEFGFARDLSDIKKKAFFFGRWAAAIFLIGLCQLGFKYNNLSHQHKKLELEAQRTFREIVPDAKNIPESSSGALTTLQARIQEYRQKQEILTAGLNDLTALAILREISEHLDPEIPIDTQELSIDRNQITLRAYTDSFASVDRIIANLREHPRFQKIDKGDIREAPGGKKMFQLVVTVGESNPDVSPRSGS